MKRLTANDFAKILWRLVADCKNDTLRDEAIQVFLEFVKEQRAQKQLGEVVRAFEAYAAKQEGKEPATVVSAHSLSEKDIVEIKEALDIQGDVMAKQDLSLLGGLIANRGNKIFDLSAKSQILALKEHLTRV